ncbi:MAG: PIN/TRAM domain-containing protein [Bacillota bacterium]|nr:PIN/TRAM domain-containing protein [Bacillota bacterium]
MLNRIIKISFSFVGGITGFTMSYTILSLINAQISFVLQFSIFVLSIIISAALFFIASAKIIDIVMSTFDNVERHIHSLSLYELTISSLGAIIGLIIANLIVIPIKSIDIIGLPLAVFANILFGCIFFAIGIAVGRRNDSLLESFMGRKNTISSVKKKLLDTCVIIDGRILDIVRTGCIDGDLIVPNFILEELRHIADSSDSLKRAKGKRGLEILSILQKEFKNLVKVEDFDGFDGYEVDDKLIKAAKKQGYSVITIDMNLNKIAGVQGVQVLNINELSNALKPIALPGDEMIIQMVKDGKEPGQGLGYLEDGTMIVVDGGKNYMGESINVVVTSNIQTAAGRMVFAKPNL